MEAVDPALGHCEYFIYEFTMISMTIAFASLVGGSCRHYGSQGFNLVHALFYLPEVQH